jgi:6-phosphogluconolactonase
MAKLVAIEIYRDVIELAGAAAVHIMEIASRALLDRGIFSIALAGGSTPKAAYALLTNAPMDWERMHMFWSDERCVPPEHPDSNYSMAYNAFLGDIDIPAGNIHRMRGEHPVQQAADEYEAELRSFFPQGTFPVFDLVLLGLGSDGHTASLFPGSPALKEPRRWVSPVEHRQPPLPLVDRLTLTFPVINAARQVTFLVSGAGKAERLKGILAPDDGQTGPLLPAQLVQPSDGSLLWLVDRAAKGE